MKNSLYTGWVYHARHRPFFHEYRYKVFSVLCDLDDMPQAKFFSTNRWNILSLYNKDHGPRDGSSLRLWIEKAAQDKGIDLASGQIFFLCFPRLWGFVFNPLSVFFCTGPDGALKAILYQVKNTFGQQHGYLLETASTDKIEQSCEKVFHVSPFIQMRCRYHFHLREPSEKLGIAIIQEEWKNGAWHKILTATWDGTREDLTDKTILKAVALHPLMTVKVVAAIHWQALKLWLKGARYIKKPPLPETEIT